MEPDFNARLKERRQRLHRSSFFRNCLRARADQRLRTRLSAAVKSEGGGAADIKLEQTADIKLEQIGSEQETNTEGLALAGSATLAQVIATDWVPRPSSQRQSASGSKGWEPRRQHRRGRRGAKKKYMNQDQSKECTVVATIPKWTRAMRQSRRVPTASQPAPRALPSRKRDTPLPSLPSRKRVTSQPCHRFALPTPVRRPSPTPPTPSPSTRTPPPRPSSKWVRTPTAVTASGPMSSVTITLTM